MAYVFASHHQGERITSSMIESGSAFFSFPCAAWERILDASHPEFESLIYDVCNGLQRSPRGVPTRRMGTRHD